MFLKWSFHFARLLITALNIAKIQSQCKWSHLWYFRPISFYAVSLWSYFKTIKQLICCDNHSDLCHLDYFDFKCFRVKVFYNICCHGYQIIESFRLPFVFSRRAFATIWMLPRYFIAIEMPVAFISVLVVSGRTHVLLYLGRPGYYFRTRPIPVALVASRCIGDERWDDYEQMTIIINFWF